MKLPGEHTLDERIVVTVARWPGLTCAQLVHRMGKLQGSTHAALRRLLAQHVLEKRVVDDPVHENYREQGYFWVSKHPM